MPEAVLSPSLTRWPPGSDQSLAERLALELANPQSRPVLVKKLSTDRKTIALAHNWEFWARPSQLPPPDPNWVYWMMLAGRGSGKTRAGAEYIRWVKQTVSPIALVGATKDDVRNIMVEGPAGLQAISPREDYPRLVSGHLEWPNGAQAFLYSAEQPNRLRGPQHAAAWCDELAAWRYVEDTWSNLNFGLRLGHKPRAVITTTPRPIKLVKELIKDRSCRVTRTSSYANRAQLPTDFFDKIIKRYEGTRIGRQEIYAEVLEDVPGALWSLANIEQNRLPYDVKLPDLMRIVVAIDPAMSSGEDADETGIVVAAKDFHGHGYVLGDASGHYQPVEWARAAIAEYKNPARPADRIVAEINAGGEMVEHTIRMVDAAIPFTAVHASRGKVMRAEPVSALYEQNRVHHVGSFPTLEDQMTSFTVDFDRDANDSPDRVDALVWALTELLIDEGDQEFFAAWGRW